jgi:hypothetical protein
VLPLLPPPMPSPPFTKPLTLILQGIRAYPTLKLFRHSRATGIADRFRLSWEAPHFPLNLIDLTHNSETSLLPWVPSLHPPAFPSTFPPMSMVDLDGK